MTTLSEAAAELDRIAERMSARLAVDIARAQAQVFLGIEKSVTPVASGRLKASERIDSVSGGGEHATATVSPHTRYAQFREEGGTITRHTPGSLGTPDVGFFGHSVYQHGSHYVATAEGIARGVLPGIAERITAGYLDEL